jgi:hypothetical protein
VNARLLPGGLVLSVAAADAAGAHGLAFYLLLGAIAATAVSALNAYGALVELPGSARRVAVARLDTVLVVLGLALALVAAAARAPALAEGVVPPLGLSALAGALCVLLVRGAVALAKPS